MKARSNRTSPKTLPWQCDTRAIEFNLNFLPRSVECGTHSGFRPCCIAFFVTSWMWLSAAERSRYWTTIDRRAREVPGYVPCPTCVARKRFVRVKSCGCSRKVTADAYARFLLRVLTFHSPGPMKHGKLGGEPDIVLAALDKAKEIVRQRERRRPPRAVVKVLAPGAIAAE